MSVVAGDVHRATVRRVLASAEQLASTLRSAGSAAGTAAVADADDGDDSHDGTGDAEATARGSLSAEEHDAEDAAILIALAFPDRVAQRRSRSNRCSARNCTSQSALRVRARHDRRRLILHLAHTQNAQGLLRLPLGLTGYQVHVGLCSPDSQYP